MFPLRATYVCWSLPHVNGSPVRGVLWTNPTPHLPSAILFFDWVGVPVSLRFGEQVGSPKFLLSFSIHAMVFDPGRPSGILPFVDSLVLASVTLNTSPSAFSHLTGLNPLQELRFSLWPIRCSVNTSPRCYQLRRITRYGWVANPCPTGTFTLPNPASFAWRTNVYASATC